MHACMVTSNHTCSVTNSARMNYFQFTDVDVDFVREQLSSLKVKKSSGMKDIHTRFLKTGADVLAAPLTYILNLSLHTATMPSSWKSAAVTLLHKNGSMSDPNNMCPPCSDEDFRTGSTPTYISPKVVEECSFSFFQSGFRPGHSTSTCLLDVSDYILKNMDQGIITGAVFLAFLPLL